MSEYEHEYEHKYEYEYEHKYEYERIWVIWMSIVSGESHFYKLNWLEQNADIEIRILTRSS